MKKIGLALVIFAGLAIFWHFLSPNIPDLDSFFYLGKAHLIREVGLADNSFPWAQFSVIKNSGSSLWFGFSLLLVPFSYIANSAVGIKLAGVLLTVFALFSCFWVANRHRLKWPIVWPLLMFFSAPNVTIQLLMTRPQTATIGTAILLWSFLTQGMPWQVLITSFFLVWIHMNFAWMPIAIAGSVLLARLFTERKVEVWKNLAVLAGVFAGWLARPNPFGAARLFYVQVVQQILEKQGGLPLLFGKENFPLATNVLLTNFLPFLLIWLVGLGLTVWFLWRKSFPANNAQKLLAISGIILSPIFFFLSIIVVRRAYDFWIAFGTIVIAIVISQILELAARRRNGDALKWAGGITITLLVFLTFFSGSKTINSLPQTYSPTYLKESADWLNQNSQPGDIVFNVHWSHFSPLFLWDRKNYYINALDPIFQYSYDPTLYWKFHYLSADLTSSFTCGKLACKRSEVEDTYQVLKNDFHAKYLLVSKVYNPRLYEYLPSDPRFQKVFEAVNETIYLIK